MLAEVQGRTQRAQERRLRADASTDSFAGSAHLAHHAERLERFQQLVALRDEGLTIKEIAHRLGMAERTVRHWVTRGIPYGRPELRRKRHAPFESFIPYVTERWNQREHHALHLFRELQAQGYAGSVGPVYRFARSLRGYTASPQGREEHARSVPEAPMQGVSAKKVVWLFLRPVAELEDCERQQLTQLCQASPTVARAYTLVRDFMEMLRTRNGAHLEDWLTSVKDSHIKELQGFVRSIERDTAAVRAGLTLPWTNGVVEGTISKLKLIKRMGFGRAGFALLRQRVLHAL